MTDDELDTAVQTLYAPVPVDPVAVSRARARVLTTVASQPEPRRRRAGIGAARSQPGRWRPAGVQARPWRGWAVAVPAAAALVAVFAATALQQQPTPPAGAMVDVGQTLRAAADAEIRTVDTPVPAGQFRYVSTQALAMAFHDQGAAVFAVRFGTRTEVWIPADHHDEWLQRESDTGERDWLVGTEEAARQAGVDESVRPPTELRARCGVWYPARGQDPCDQQEGWGSPGDEFIASLSRDPRTLYNRLRAETHGKGNDPDQEILVYVADVLRAGRLPADLRAAFYRTLALVPGLIITERTATMDGRTGTAFGITAAGRTQEIIIDPRSGDFIGERTRLAVESDGMAAGTVTESSSVSYGISTAAGKRPGG